MSLTADDPRPPYVQAADELRREIRTGELKPGQKLPSVRQLSERFGVAQMTVNNALRMLREEGLTVSTPGRGTYVRTELPADVGEVPPQCVALAEQVNALEVTVRELSERLERLESQTAGRTPAERSGSVAWQ
jgi:GntR family transcriptional regulator